LPQPPRRSSDNDQLWTDIFFTEMGIPLTHTIDTLLGYAYMQKQVQQANLELPTPEHYEAGGKPFARYVIEVKAKRRYRIAQWGMNRGGVLGKLVYLVMGWLGSPNQLARTLVTLGRGYLPPSYTVTCEVVTSSLSSPQQ
jgi:hypothetical protein